MRVNYGVPDSKVHGANMGPIWGQQDPGGPHVGPMNFAIWDVSCEFKLILTYVLYLLMSCGMQYHVTCILYSIIARPKVFNTLEYEQNGRYFADNIFKYILYNEKVWVLIKINRLRFGAQQVASNYLNQCWPECMTCHKSSLVLNELDANVISGFPCCNFSTCFYDVRAWTSAKQRPLWCWTRWTLITKVATSMISRRSSRPSPTRACWHLMRKYPSSSDSALGKAPKICKTSLKFGKLNKYLRYFFYNNCIIQCIWPFFL